MGPFYYRNDAETTSGALFPIVYFGKNHTSGIATSFVLPLYLDIRRAEDRQLAAYTPLIWRYHSVEATTTIGLPRSSTSTAPASRAPPAFCRCSSATARKWATTARYTIPAALVLVAHARRQSKTDAVVFPLFWHFGGKNSTTMLAPFVWDFKRGESRTTVAFPIFAHWHRPSATAARAQRLLPKGLGEQAGSWHLDVFPLLQVGRPRKQDLEWYFLEGLFGYSRQGRNRNLRLFWVLDFALEPVPASNLSWFGSTSTQSREALLTRALLQLRARVFRTLGWQSRRTASRR